MLRAKWQKMGRKVGSGTILRNVDDEGMSQSTGESMIKSIRGRLFEWSFLEWLDGPSGVY